MQFKTVTSATVADILFGRAGLIVGPGATTNSSLYAEIAQSLGAVRSAEISGLRSLGKGIRDAGLDESDIWQKIGDLYGKIPASPYLTTLAKPNWKAVVSLALDSNLEDRLQIECDRKPARRPLTKVTDLASSFPSRSTPVYKMMGALGQPGCVLFEEDYLRIRANWRHALSGFCDVLSGSPALCVGVDGDCEATLDLISEMLASKDTRPSGLILLADDSLLKNKSFINLTKGRLKLFVFTESLSALVSRISKQESVGRTQKLNFVDEGESLLTRYEDVCVVVESTPPATLDNVPKIALLDSLFSPSVPDWNPYFKELDFRRDLEQTLVAEIRDAARTNSGTHSCVAITGSAANGKTTMLKRVALVLASIPHATIWITASPLEAPERFFHEFFRDFRQTNPDVDHVYCVIDDPIRSRSGEIESILGSAAALGISVTLIIAVRSSEWSALDHGRMAGYSTSVTDLVLPDDFTPAELDRLPTYLVSIGAAADIASGQVMLDRIDNSKVQDVLNTLYAIVPNTRSVIVSSVRDEYCRLGDLGGLRERVRGVHELGTSAIREAYDLTAVANIYGCDLPFEILRAAIGFEWSEASDLLASNSAVWGILYTIENAESISLRTRNQIVAETIVTLVNGGTYNRLGEVRLLLKLIEACRGKTAIIYRNFIAKLLIGNEYLIRLGYDDGRELYEAAVSVLVAPDKALVHHMGIWADRHSKSSEALAIYSRALTTPDYPYTQRTESDVNIHTSMASAVLSEIRAGTKTLIDGRREAEEHLSKARRGSIGDAHVVHVNAGITLQLLKAIPEQDDTDRLHIASNAVGDIDKLDMMDESPVAFRKRSRKSEGMLLSARESLYSAALPKHNREEFAVNVWEKGRNQDGFIIVARKRLSDIRQNAGKGKEYKELYDYILSCRNTIISAGRTPDSRFSEVQAEAFYWWRVHRAMQSPLESEIAWPEFLNVLNEVVKANDSHGHQRWFQFLKGYALCQLGDWQAGETEFADLRRADIPPNILWLPRAHLLNEKGGQRTVQGIVREYSGRTFLEVEDFSQTFLADKKDRWNAPGLTDHANIRFSFAGPRAVHDA